jgi:hypothetical protein
MNGNGVELSLGAQAIGIFKPETPLSIAFSLARRFIAG